MDPIAERISRYLLRRIRRLAILDLYAHAAGAGLLNSRHFEDEKTTGTIWSISTKGLGMLAGDRNSALRLVASALKSGPAREVTDEFDDQTTADPWSEAVAEAGKASRMEAASATKGYHRETQLMLGLLRDFLPAPVSVHVAMALLVARSVSARQTDLEALREVLQRPNAVLLFRVPVSGFERQLGLMLENALIAPFWASLKDIAGGTALSSHFRESRTEKLRRKVMTASGRSSTSVADRTLRRQLSNAVLGEAVPMVIADETSASLRPQFAAAADIVFECTGFDLALVAELLHLCCGIQPRASLDRMKTMAFDPSDICLDDLALAVRPGRSLEAILETLVALAAAHVEEEDHDDESDKTGRWNGGSKSSIKGKSKSISVDIIQPESSANEKTTDSVNAKAGGVSDVSSMVRVTGRLRVETLTGYGEAKGWALDLKEDLPLWREGAIGWDEMSTKMMLSGPPGTGKTTFARALCNTLQVPLIVTSVASWLEPGYLGDVLKRMSAVFEAARETAPCIVFIDEIDAIGSRGSGRGKRDDDYWSTLTTRLLELLDGALKSEGVIVVGATNLPDKIDAALLRSGRLEKHVMIPPPDVQALAGILAHHLGSDLAAVLATAPAHAEPKQQASARDATANSPINSKAPFASGATTRKGQAYV
ncbi:ATP-binding protein [Hoeflea sp.]|uniref:ATP-binding protein n=1 Tax=Hoeflea sp. TaxID=1940281 RepID=UPI0019A394B5|nr:ATP-binding protein [Hoeflea sp.]MBC7284667.1 AAA family ATPase [Hoeflea sp.]